MKSKALFAAVSISALQSASPVATAAVPAAATESAPAFTLGAGPAPITERTLAGERKLEQLEAALIEKIGVQFAPAGSGAKVALRSSFSRTYDCSGDANSGPISGCVPDTDASF